MLISTNFTTNDYEIIKKNKKGYKIYLFIYFVFLVPLSFLIGVLGLSKKGYGYWPTLITSLLLFLFLIIYLIIKDYILHKKDLKTRLKYVGTVTVLKKSGNKNDCIIYVDSDDLKKIDVLFANVFDQIEIGDELYIEITKFTKYIIKLEKGIFPLLTND